jgi:hypothetical protein
MTLPQSNQRPRRRFLKVREARPIPPSKSAGNGKTTEYAVLRLPSFKGSASAAKFVGAVIVSVEVPELAPSVTGDGETLHVAIGAGPVTAQMSVTGPEKPFCPVKVKTSVTCAPVCTVKLVDAGASVKSGGGGLNVAVTVWAEFMVTLQTFGSVPVQAPPWVKIPICKLGLLIARQSFSLQIALALWRSINSLSTVTRQKFSQGGRSAFARLE